MNLDSRSAAPEKHEYYMRLALQEAAQAAAAEEAPIGVVIVRGDQVLAAAHAEMIALTQAAAALGSWRLAGCTLYVTLEPCPMCAGAIVQARVPHVVYGAADPKAGAVDSLYQLLNDDRLNHSAHITRGVLAEECGEILREFFRQRR